MEKITEKIAALPPGSNYFSLEFFPPKTSIGAHNLRTRLDRMSRALRPLFVTVTWGAGGSTATNSLELAELCQQEMGLTTCLHLTCTNMSRDIVHQALEKARASGIRNILALRGDSPRKDYIALNSETNKTFDFEWAIDLVRYIKQNYGDYFCIGVAAYPEGHADGNNPDEQSLEFDLPYLVDKVKAGADFIMTQLFFDTDAYAAFEKRLLEHESGCFKSLPIIPGLMPIQSYQMIMRTVKLTHVRIPPKIATRLTTIKGDDDLIKKAGIDIISEIVSQIQCGPPLPLGKRGFHFYTLNLEKAVSFILERTSLIPSTSLALSIEGFNSNGATMKSPTLSSQVPCANSHIMRPWYQDDSAHSDKYNPVARNRSLIIDNPLTEITSFEGSHQLDAIKICANTLAISEGTGNLGREATWDDFPNGRWGDARSPAYGEIDGYGVSIHVSSNEAIRLWGYPQTIEDISTIFTKHIEGSLSAIPWSDEAICRETILIKDKLLAVNKKGWWTIASQPAVNGLKSSDDIFGWGPRNGFVFQKAFVELFLKSDDWQLLRTKLQKTTEADCISWYACNSKGEFFSSHIPVKSSKYKTTVGTTNAVTWGVFPGKEIITPTIIEEISFRAWAEEAFDIWTEWSKVYTGPNSIDNIQRAYLSQKLIKELREEVWLVNIIHHGFNERDDLWDLLLE